MIAPLRSLAPRDRRAVVLGAVCLAVAWTGLRGVPSTVRGWQSLRDRHATAVERLVQATALLEAEADLRDSLTLVARELVGWADRLVPGRTAAAGAAELAAVLRLEAERRGLRVERLDPLPDSTRGMFRLVAVRVVVEGDVVGLGAYLADIEGGRRLLRVREAALTPSDPLAPGTQAEVLRAELVITGWAVLPTSEVPGAGT